MALERSSRWKEKDDSLQGREAYPGASIRRLSIEKMLEFGKQYPNVQQALPVEPREIMKLHR